MKLLSKTPDKTAFILFLAIFLLGSCSLLQQRRRIPECKELFEQIENGWYRDSASGLYRLTAKAMEGHRFGNIHDDKCLLGLAPSEIEKLFGSPDTTYLGRFEYYMSEPCLGKGGSKKHGCHYMSCFFDSEGGLKGIRFTTLVEDIDYIDSVPDLNKERK